MGRQAAVAVAMLLLALALPPAASSRWLQQELPPQNHPCSPQQVHLALTGTPDQLRVQWKTRGEGCPSRVTYGPAAAAAAETSRGGAAPGGTPVDAAAHAALVAAGADPAALRTHEGRHDSYSNRDMCAAPARNFHFEPLYLHSALLAGLTPGGEHFYQLEHGAPVAFTALPPIGPRESLRFVVFGDMGESEHPKAKSPGAWRTMKAIKREVREGGAQLVLHVGDISYGNGRPEIWDTFMDSIEPFAQRVPYMVAIGNHEYDYERSGDGDSAGEGDSANPDASGEEGPYNPDWGNYGNDSGGECGVAVSKRFSMPEDAEAGYWPQGGPAATNDSSSDSSSAGDSDSSGDLIGGSGNPTLGPNAAARLAQLAAEAAAATAAEGGSGSGEGIPRRSSIQVAGALPGLALPGLSLPQQQQHQQKEPNPQNLQQQQQQQQQWERQQQLQQQQQQSVASLAAEVPAAGAEAGAAGGDGGDDANRHAPHPNPPFWYSVSQGSVHFVVLSSEHDLSHSSKQYRWLKHDLRRVDRCRTPWVVAVLHRPIYVVYPHKSNRVVGDHLRAQVERLLNKFEVDLMFSGHVHSYSRTCNIWEQQCLHPDRGGLTYITVGCAGRKLTDVAHSQPEWLEYAAVRFGYGRVTVEDGASLLFEYITTEDDRVHDSVKLFNSRANRRGCNNGLDGGPTPAPVATSAAAAAAAAA